MSLPKNDCGSTSKFWKPGIGDLVRLNILALLLCVHRNVQQNMLMSKKTRRQHIFLVDSGERKMDKGMENGSPNPFRSRHIHLKL